MVSDCIMTIPNDLEGNAFLKQFKKYANKKAYKIVVRGRGNRKMHISTELSHHSLRQDLPIRLAERLAVYMNSKIKPNNQWN